MRAVVQRVKGARVVVGGSSVGEIERGLLVYIGVEKGDGPEDVAYMAGKISSMRVFGDSFGRMNLDIEEAGGGVLVVSQFTLAGDLRKGRRPSFDNAEAPERAGPLYRSLIEALKEKNLTVKEGVFRAHMEVESINDGPVTFLLDSKKRF